MKYIKHFETKKPDWFADDKDYDEWLIPGNVYSYLNFNLDLCYAVFIENVGGAYPYLVYLLESANKYDEKFYFIEWNVIGVKGFDDTGKNLLEFMKINPKIIDDVYKGLHKRNVQIKAKSIKIIKQYEQELLLHKDELKPFKTAGLAGLL